jgi:CheY-like chemotaxis protein
MPGNPPRILCVDDQPEHLKIRKLLLEQFGCYVVAVHSAQECLRAATHEPFDLALVDYHLDGEMTGEDVCRDLRVCVPGIALVMLTGDAKIPESARAFVDAVIVKGASNPNDLFWTIEELLPDCTMKPRHPMSPKVFKK